ncbi:sugar phosphate isomerase/epimerase family protein [Pseudothioclava arenosa]|uniref:Xylose isomerase-like TIM barrel domain-containing protein n=1 Tax=Pseudothioclava arenosa TaxID=1795308 RepID=A0A2A4CMG4_9RHOB|nr:TIM barrel protein [Pseudothioclava arenosa]PCD75785.1 hypothetical protein CLN94_11535 [Pseudothioclava arenosa]
MKLAASNIAWNPAQRLEAYRLLAEAGFGGLEIAPNLFLASLDDPFCPAPAEVAARRAEIAAFGLDLVSLQAPLFGVEGVALFETAAERQRLVEGMERAIRLAGMLAIPNIVFGSPRQRVVPSGMSADVAEGIAAETLAALADLALAEGCKIALEPNAREYGTNFLTTLEDTTRFLDRIDHPALTLNLDFGTLWLSGEIEGLDLSDCIGRVSHVHISEPMLAPAPASAAHAARAVAALRAVNWVGSTSIEMRMVPDDPGLTVLAGCLRRLGDALEENHE